MRHKKKMKIETTKMNMNKVKVMDIGHCQDQD